MLPILLTSRTRPSLSDFHSNDATSLYGSNTWDIFSPDCERLYNSYNAAIRIVLDVDRCTHRYMIEPLSGNLHLKTMLASRYSTFHTSLIQSRKLPVRFLARLSESDNRTVLGRTLSTLRNLCGQRDDTTVMNSTMIKRKLCYQEPSESEAWRPDLGKELLMIREGKTVELPGFTNEECADLLHYVCTT